MEISTFPPVAEAKGRLLATTDPFGALDALNELRDRGSASLTPAELSHAAGIVAGLRDVHRCLACGEALGLDWNVHGTCLATWPAEFELELGLS